jgi:GNAT superfamily N-acetyltransferase
VPALVQLRTANAERHAGLDPAGHRIPESAPVVRYFEELLSGPPGDIVVLVAEVDETVALVLERFRGRGAGSALVRAAEWHAAQHGVVAYRADSCAEH